MLRQPAERKSGPEDVVIAELKHKFLLLDRLNHPRIKELLISRSLQVNK